MIIDTWEKLIDTPGGKIIRLVEMELSKHLTGTSWTQHSQYTNCYRRGNWVFDTAMLAFGDRDISRVKQNDVYLTERSTIALCNTNVGSFFVEHLDPTRNYVWVHCNDIGSLGKVPSAYTMQMFFWIYLSTGGVTLTPTIGGKTYTMDYLPLVKQVSRLTVEVKELFFGQANNSGCSLEILNGAHADYGGVGPFDLAFEEWTWENRRVRILTGGEQLPYSEYKTTFTGSISSVEFGWNRLNVKIESMMALLDKKIPTITYEQSDTPSAPGEYQYLEPSAKGKSIARIFGTCWNVKPVQVNTHNWTFRLGVKFKKLLKVRSGGVVVWEYGDGEGALPLVMADVHHADGTFQLNSWTGAVLTCDVEGEDSDGTLVDTYGGIAQMLLEEIPGLSVDTASFNQVITDCPQKVGILVSSPTKISQILDSLANSVAAWIGNNREGKITTAKWTLPNESSPDATFEHDEIKAGTIKKSSGKMYEKVNIGYRKNNCVQSDTAYKEPAGGGTPTKEDWSEDYLWVKTDYPQNKYLYECEELLEIGTCLVSESDAQDIADIYSAILRPWYEMSIESRLRPVEISIGDDIKVNANRLNNLISYFKVTEVEDSGSSNRISVKGVTWL